MLTSRMQYAIIESDIYDPTKNTKIIGIKTMNNTLFYDSFQFIRWEKRGHYHLVNRGGTRNHYIAHLRSGNVRLVCDDGEVVEVLEGEFFYLPIGLKYQSFWESGEGGDLISWNSCAFVYCPEREMPSFPIQKFEGTPEEIAMIEQICSESTVNTESVAKFYRMIALMPRLKGAKRDPKEQLRKRIFEYIRRNPTFKAAELARECCMSESTLFLYFKNYLRTTPVALKWKILVERAEPMLLYTDMTVEEISLELGFESCAHFRKIFKHERGITPSELRRQNQNGL